MDHQFVMQLVTTSFAARPTRSEREERQLLIHSIDSSAVGRWKSLARRSPRMPERRSSKSPSRAKPSMNVVAIESQDALTWPDTTSWVAEVIEAYKAEGKSESTMDLMEEAKTSYRAGEYRAAAIKFAHMLANSRDEETKNSIISNIGSCLHMMGEHDLAGLYYKTARDAFAAVKPGRVSRFLFGDYNPARVAVRCL